MVNGNTAYMRDMPMDNITRKAMQISGIMPV